MEEMSKTITLKQEELERFLAEKNYEEVCKLLHSFIEAEKIREHTYSCEEVVDTIGKVYLYLLKIPCEKENNYTRYICSIVSNIAIIRNIMNNCTYRYHTEISRCHVENILNNILKIPCVINALNNEKDRNIVEGALIRIVSLVRQKLISLPQIQNPFII